MAAPSRRYGIAIRCLGALMMLQSGLGLLFRDAYRDTGWILLTWLGNDGVTLLVVVPALIAAFDSARRRSPRGQLLLLGVVGYGLYNYPYYAVGASLNYFFPLYVALLITAAAAFILGLRELDADALALPSVRVSRASGAFLVAFGILLAISWLTMWALYAFFGRPTPIAPDEFRLVAVLDLTIMAPAFVVSGVLLWRRHRWGVAAGVIAATQGALYLLVLTVNSVLMIQRGLAQGPGEVPIWGALGVSSAAVMMTLLSGSTVRRRPA